MAFTYDYPRPSVTVDLVIFTIQRKALQVLLIQRGDEPYKGSWALPGGFVREDENLDNAAQRELEEETGVKEVYLEQLFTFGQPGRDPRGRVITVAYYALISADRQKLRASTDAENVRWFPTNELPSLAFDHAKILGYAKDRLKNKLEYTTVGFQLLPERFTLSELQTVYETILEHPLDKRNFRRKIALLDLVDDTGDKRMDGVHRPARLFKFKKPADGQA
jgi:8-oxo-dGTP diphosphatase